jgi:hypothetical protein
MKAILKELVYVHSLFSFFLYLVGSVIVTVIVEYKLKNPNLKHTLAGFFAVALSGFAAYIIPMKFFTHLSPLAMQLVGIAAAFFTQALFWALWFRKKFPALMSALLIAFVLTAVIAVAAYFIFMGYINMIVQGAIQSVNPIVRYFVTKF